MIESDDPDDRLRALWEPFDGEGRLPDGAPNMNAFTNVRFMTATFDDLHWTRTGDYESREAALEAILADHPVGALSAVFDRGEPVWVGKVSLTNVYAPNPEQLAYFTADTMQALMDDLFWEDDDPRSD